MGDLAGILPIGGGGSTVRPHVETTTQAVPAVQSSVAGQSLAGQNGSGGSQGKGQKSNGADTAPAFLRKSPVDPNAHAGPTPAFQVSVLEMDKDLQQALARLEAKHAKPENDAAIAPAPKAEAVAATRKEDVSEPAPEVKVEPSTDAGDSSGAAPAPVEAETVSEKTPDPVG